MNVVVVGGGPAGSVLALRLARAGIPVTLLERAEPPRAKPCGDCLSAEATRILDRLGLLHAVQSAAPARLEGWRVFAPGGHAFAARFAALESGDPRLRHALSLPRVAFDAILLRAAHAAGADVRTRTAVTAVRPGAAPVVSFRGPAGPGTIHPDLVVGADGLRSIVVRRLGLVRRRARVRKVSLTAHIENASLPDAHGEMHVIEGMCAGLAPVGRGRFNLTIVADSDRHGRAIARDTAGFFADALHRFPALPARLRDARLEGRALLDGPPARDALLASGPFDVPVRSIAGPGWTLVGDAAGYFDPFTGQGICHAMRGGELLADAILAAAARPAHAGRAFARYAAAQRHLTRPARIVQRLVDTILRRPALADRAIARLARAPRAAHALLAVTGDMLPARGLLSPAVLLSFALPQPRRSVR